VIPNSITNFNLVSPVYNKKCGVGSMKKKSGFPEIVGMGRCKVVGTVKECLKAIS
jgi:hypothetical protein